MIRSPWPASEIVAALLRCPDKKIGPFSSILSPDFLLWGLEAGRGDPYITEFRAETQLPRSVVPLLQFLPAFPTKAL